MEYLIIWISGIITTISLVLLNKYYNLYNKTKSNLDMVVPLYQDMIKEKKEQESLKRLAKFKTTGWHLTKDKDDPKKKTWDVFFELREVASSVDESKSKFEVISVISEGTTDLWSETQYNNWFIKNTGGGWIKVDNKNLEWITSLTKSESRDLKLKKLGL